MPTILLIDSDPIARHTAAPALATRFDTTAVYTAEDGAEGLRLIQEHAPDLVIFDLMLSGVDGLELLAYMQAEAPGTSLLVTAENGFILRDLQKHFGDILAVATLEKPCTAQDIVEAAAELMQMRPASVIRDVALVSVLQLAHLEGKSCRLEAEGAGWRGTIHFVHGQVVRAVCGAFEGIDAVKEMVGQTRPVCRIYSAESLTKPRNIHAQFTELLLICCSATDEKCQVA